MGERRGVTKVAGAPPILAFATLRGRAKPGRGRHECLLDDGIALANRAALNRTRGRNEWIFFTGDLASNSRSS
jgi:hypothetical protein